MKILVYQTRGSVAFPLEEILKERGHQVVLCHSLEQAIEAWDKDKSFDCIIAETNDSPQGLTKKERELSQTGLLSGWIWLKNYVFRIKPEMRVRTIMYTDYIKEIYKFVPYKKLRDIHFAKKYIHHEVNFELVLYYVEIIENLEQ